MSGWEPEVGSGGTRYAVQSGMAHIFVSGIRKPARSEYLREEVEAQGRIERQRSLLIDVRFSSGLVESWKSSSFVSQYIVSQERQLGKELNRDVRPSKHSQDGAKQMGERQAGSNGGMRNTKSVRFSYKRREPEQGKTAQSTTNHKSVADAWL